MPEKGLSRRAILTGIPAAAIGIVALGATAAAATVDPIFAAIERHRAAFKTAREIEAMEEDEAVNVEWDANRKAYEALIVTIPTTITGVRAAIEWLAKYDEGCIPEDSGQFHKSLRKSPALLAA